MVWKKDQSWLSRVRVSHTGIPFPECPWTLHVRFNTSVHILGTWPRSSWAHNQTRLRLYGNNTQSSTNSTEWSMDLYLWLASRLSARPVHFGWHLETKNETLRSIGGQPVPSSNLTWRVDIGPLNPLLLSYMMRIHVDAETACGSPGQLLMDTLDSPHPENTSVAVRVQRGAGVTLIVAWEKPLSARCTEEVQLELQMQSITSGWNGQRSRRMEKDQKNQVDARMPVAPTAFRWLPVGQVLPIPIHVQYHFENPFVELSKNQ